MEFNKLESENLAMLADFYEFTMANGYMESGMSDQIAYFDLYFRSIPDAGGYAITAGLEQAIDYLQHLKFTEDDIEYFKNRGIFSDEFLDKLRNFEFVCDVWAIPEGTPVFPQMPLMIVRGPVWQAQMIETMLLLTINHQTLIATKTSRIVRAADGRSVMEFGSRRAHGYTAATLGARAAYIGGAIGTANTLADQLFNIPALGTMAHSWVQMFPTEYEAFEAYAKAYPNSTTLLVDTYNTLESGVPNAIKVFDEVLKPMGKRPVGIRLDSGDLAYLSKEARKMLDEAGYEDCQIVASSSLDEFVISDLLKQGAQIDSFGVGERLITARSHPVFGGVYKLTSAEENGQIVNKIKVSENVEKITTPGFKQVYRFIDKNTNKAMADVITLHHEVIDEDKEYNIFHPLHTWKKKTLKNFKAVALLERIFDKGKLVYKRPSIEEIREYTQEQLGLLWEETLRLVKPQKYIVDLSLDLWKIQQELLNKHDVELGAVPNSNKR